MTWDSVDLPEPFGPMIACTSPGFTVSVSPWRISRSSTRTCRFLTSSNDISCVLKLFGRFQALLDAIEPQPNAGNIGVVEFLDRDDACQMLTNGDHLDTHGVHPFS